MKKIRLEIVALTHSVSQSHNYAIILGEVDGTRRLPIVIGAFEAQAIAVAMERMIPNRPMTHDLFKNTLDRFEIELREIIISDLESGVFYSSLVCERDGESVEIDSRTSDAVAMAVRFNCPIYVYDKVLEEAGVEVEDEGESPAAKTPSRKKSIKAEAAEAKGAKATAGNRLSAYSIQDLKKLLDETLAEENYEKAAQIRDEINRREKEG